MRVLLDNNVDRRFAGLLDGYAVSTAYQMGWADLKNGQLILVAEESGFSAIITADKNLSYQQNLGGRKISIIVLSSRFTDLAGITPLANQVRQALEDLPEGEFLTIKPQEP